MWFIGTVDIRMASLKPATIQGTTRRGSGANISLLLSWDCHINIRLPCLYSMVHTVIRPETSMTGMTKMLLLVLLCGYILWYTQKWFVHAFNMHGLLFGTEIRYFA